MQANKQDLVSFELNDFQIGDLDVNLRNAAIEAIRTKSLTPILKQELKLKIQTARLAAGKEELPNIVFREPEKYQPTSEEQVLQTKRRECNRIAARKCRDKRKTKLECAKAKKEELENKNRSLKTKVEELESEIYNVKEQLRRCNISYEQPYQKVLGMQPLLTGQTFLEMDSQERPSVAVACTGFNVTEPSTSSCNVYFQNSSRSFAIPPTANLPLADKDNMMIEQVYEEQYSATLRSPTSKLENSVNLDTDDEWMASDSFLCYYSFPNEMQSSPAFHMSQTYSTNGMPSPLPSDIFTMETRKDISENAFIESRYF